jgi:predicted translin family RNA/ssDNA-binding protein
MIDKKDIERIKRDVEESDSLREKIISISRDILKASKKSIYSVHRKDLKGAEALIKLAEADIAKAKKFIKGYSRLEFSGSFHAAIQEYVEAKTFVAFVRNGKIPTYTELDVSVENYLLGICDLTGELERLSVNAATDKKLVFSIRDAIDEIMGLFIELNLGNSELRKKADSIKWVLRKVEEIVYDFKK